jgi:uncharacterized protein (TIGR03437 family)
LVVSGFGFYQGGGGITATKVYIKYGTVTTWTDLSTITSATGNQTGGVVSVINPSTMIITIPFEDATPVGILSAAQSVTLGVSNNSGVTISSAALNITNAPIIYSVTDSAGLQEAAPGVSPNFAPYELVTIFGANFCGTTGCTQPVVATTTDNRYQTSLTTGGNPLMVTFNNQSGAAIPNGNAFLLFATANQINALVPSAIIGTGITGLQIVVSYNGTNSAPFSANPAAVNPGIFTTSSSGEGQGAILRSSDYSVIGSGNPAVAGTDTVLIYMSGLGAPNSTGALNTSTKTAPVFPTNCFELSLYVTGADLTNPATADGAVLQTSVWGAGNLPPCFSTKNYVTVDINGVAATVSYAGWVADSVAGLYQINAAVPKTATTSATAVSVPVTVTVDGVAAQTGVTMYVKQ